MLPGEQTVCMRGSQVHHNQLPIAEAGRRVAVNLTGVHFDDVHRGNVLGKLDLITPTKILDCRLASMAPSTTWP